MFENDCPRSIVWSGISLTVKVCPDALTYRNIREKPMRVRTKRLTKILVFIMEILDNKRVHSFGLKAVSHNSYKNTNLPVKFTDNLMNCPKRNSGG